MEFIPTNDNEKTKVPFYDDVLGKSSDGWTGHTTTDTVDSLKSKISAALGRLGALVTGFQSGKFLDEQTGMYRQAIRIHYAIQNKSGESWPGQIDVAALPVDEERCQNDKSYKNKLDKSLRMALYMTLTAIQGAWNMKVLSPGYSPLMPWLLAEENKTFSQKFEQALELGGFAGLLPTPGVEDEPIVDGEFTEAGDG